MKVSFNPFARQEFAEAAGWYADEAGPLRANDFRNEIQRSLKLISEHPALGTPSAHDTRRLVVHRYPYSIVYRVELDVVRVLAIASQRRRPGFWSLRR